MGLFRALWERNISQIRALLDRKDVDPNERDAIGTTALHYACSLGHQNIVETLLDCTRVNVNVQDYESGYTALHRALYNGHLRLALQLINMRPDCDLYIRDKEGNTCIELLNSTFAHPEKITAGERSSSSLLELAAGINSKEASEETNPRASTSVWSWGSNRNYVLGHESDDRAIPERVYLAAEDPSFAKDVLERHKQLRIKAIYMSKYHSCVLTDEKVFSYGYGAYGRLGLGHQETSLRPALVDIEDVIALALGPDHTVAITQSGDVYTWGSNRHGQLGYQTDMDGEERSPQLLPKEVGGTLKKIRILGATASKYHTAVHTEKAVYTWGRSVGQLGCTVPKDEVQLYPKKVTQLAQHTIVQIASSNHATAVLVAPLKDVYLLTNSLILKVSVPILPRAVPKSDVRVIGSDSAQILLLRNGDVFFLNFASDATPKFKRAWTGRAGHLHATDAALGIDGSLVLCTRSGHVYLGTRRKDGSNTNQSDLPSLFKFNRIQLLHHVGNVVASSGGGYASLRKDRLPDPPKAVKSTLKDDLKHLFSMNSAGLLGRSGALGPLEGDSDSETDHDTSDAESVTHSEDSPDVRFMPEVDRFADVRFVTDDGTAILAHRIMLACRCSFFMELFSSFLRKPPNAKETLSIDVHNAGVARRNSQTAQSLVMEIKNNEVGSPTAMEISVKNTFAESICLVIEFLYSGAMRHLSMFDSSAFSNRGENPLQRERSAMVYQQVNALVKAWDLGDVDLLMLRGDVYSSSNAIAQSIGSILKHDVGAQYSSGRSVAVAVQVDNPYKAFCDVVVSLAGGTSLVDCHRAILATRCPFFAALLGSGADWVGERDAKMAKTVVRLEHLSNEVFSIILTFIYGAFEPATASSNEDSGDSKDVDGIDRDMALFSMVQVTSQLDFINFVVDVLAAADELMIEGLKQSCGRILCSFVDLSNAVTFAEIADVYNLTEMRDSCLKFVVWNLETLIENRTLLSYLPDRDPSSDFFRRESLKSESEISEAENRAANLDMIEDALQNAQLLKFQVTRGPDGLYATVRRKSNELLEERKRARKQRFLDRQRESFTATSSSSAAEGSFVGGGSFSSINMGSSLESISDLDRRLSLPVSSAEQLPLDEGPSVGVSSARSDLERESNVLGVSSVKKDSESIFDLEMDEPVVVSSSPDPPSPKLQKRWSATPSPGVKVSLRDVMAEEKTERFFPKSPKNALAPTPKAKVSTEVSPAISVPIKSAGLSQRQRRSQLQTSTAPPVQASPSKQNPWSRNTVGTDMIFDRQVVGADHGQHQSLLTPSLSQSLEGKDNASQDQLLFAASPFPPPLPSSSRRDLGSSKAQLESQFSNPFIVSPLGQSTSPASRSFAAIQAQQNTERIAIENLVQKRKPLAQIQAEERARTAIKAFYEQTREPLSGEWFDVKVVDIQTS
ncbi:hypothetical protein BJ742DRAFT_840217 [Cladochytrium replicatum]|nr:hypothetical protein BJ742DRAFT_840217 [Cladochytrium replicatum]